jgi:hypothetical protein
MRLASTGEGLLELSLVCPFRRAITDGSSARDCNTLDGHTLQCAARSSDRHLRVFTRLGLSDFENGDFWRARTFTSVQLPPAKTKRGLVIGIESSCISFRAARTVQVARPILKNEERSDR